MNTKTQTKIIRQGEYLAEIQITLTYGDRDWSPYISLEEAEKLDNLRLALQNQNLQVASKLAKIYHLTPVELSA